MSSRLSLLQKVAIAAALPILVLGVVLQRGLESQVRQRALANAVESTKLVATLGIQPQLSAGELTSGLSDRQIAELDRALAGAQGGQLARIKIWNRDATIVYSDDHSLIGRSSPDGPSDSLAESLAGETHSELLDADAPGGGDEDGEEVDVGTEKLLNAYGELLEVYTPLTFGKGQAPAGVFEMYVPYGPTESTVARDVHRIQLLLIVGLGVLYLVLLPIVLGASRQLRKQAQIEREAADRLRQADELKTQFLTAVSHELRTPLSAVLGCAISLRTADDLGLSREDVRDLTERLEANARKLNRLVSDLLDLDRLAQGIIEPRRAPTDVAELVRQAIAETGVAETRTVHVDAAPLVVDVDAAKVERIVESLLVNVQRHSTGTNLWVRVEPQDEGVLLVVEDDGAGVPPELRARIFEPFDHGDDVKSYAPGVGVGLSIVANFAQLHGGRAWVEDRAGGGASFHVELPGAITPAAALEPVG
ncbi:MAG TPA: HAMP domain-containing sensor histidine kinase [Actinomycetota bacterium]|nr:HAMP domain-containing sensor histidine kinase [Actinomycetota bacterium]